MIKKFLIVCTLIFSSCFSYGQQAYMAPLVKKSLLLDIAKSDFAIAVGERGHILKFELDDIESIKQVPVPTRSLLTAIEHIENDFYVVGHDASILRSENSGDSWQLVYNNPELDRPFLDVLFLSASEGLAVGAYGLFYRTLDGGETWQAELHASVLNDEDIEYLESIKDDPAFYREELSYILPHFNRIRKKGDKLLIAGEAGLLAESLDKGHTWQRLRIDYFGSFFDFIELSHELQIAIGLRGHVFVRNNNSPWSSLNTCVTTSLNAIVPASNGAYAVGNNGVVLHIDASKLENVAQTPQSQTQACVPHSAISFIDNDISSSISDGIYEKNILTLVTANGLKQIAVSL
ncbi:WD40/YVTN/BNR-like repeat-containing protein [Agaribacter flavus]|uniref:WD40/YVTN/BNR-like repeat-containing protein n=1 Tax=Agaribacter flavus TaxID=1902781 RepID=A0ABV7FR04_9ALTE